MSDDLYGDLTLEVKPIEDFSEVEGKLKAARASLAEVKKQLDETKAAVAVATETNSILESNITRLFNVASLEIKRKFEETRRLRRLVAEEKQRTTEVSECLKRLQDKRAPAIVDPPAAALPTHGPFRKKQ